MTEQAGALDVDMQVPFKLEPLLEAIRFKGAKGGRGSGKSHFFAESVVEAMMLDPDCAVVCIREIQKSLKFSAKRLIESKIRQFKLQAFFKITETEIRRIGGTGVCIFQGMQDHTADSIKSLEDFKIAWVEEAQSLSQRSLDLLTPTIRAPGSEVWFSWNPDQPDDPVEKFFADADDDPKKHVVHINYLDNPMCPQETKDDAAAWLKRDPETYGHVWLGEYNFRSEAQIFKGKWRVEDAVPATKPGMDGPYFGGDWGFANDPTALIRMYIHQNTLYITHQLYKVGLELDDTPDAFGQVPGAREHLIRADNARPETISHVRKRGFNIIAAKKWAGSVKDGITFLRSFDAIVIDSGCVDVITEARLYSYKVDKRTGNILPEPVDDNNHAWDAIRYALAPLIEASKQGSGAFTW